MDLICFLKTISKMQLNETEKDFLIKNIDSITDKEYQLLEHHKINLILFKHLKHLEKISSLNPKKMKQYSNQLFVLQKQYEEYVDASVLILNEFEKNDIQYAVLKGFSFAKELYSQENIIYRTFADIDILINANNSSNVTQIMERQQFIQGKVINDAIVPINRSQKVYWILNSHQLPEFIRFSKYANISPKYWVEVDINTTIFEGGKIIDPIPTGRILENIKKISFSKDQGYYVLTPTYNLIQICYHFYKDTVYETKKKNHNDYCLIKFCDIREFILHYRNEIDWFEFIEVVNEFNIGNQIYYSLYLVASFYEDLDIEEIIKKIKTTRLFSVDYLDWERMLL